MGDERPIIFKTHAGRRSRARRRSCPASVHNRRRGRRVVLGLSLLQKKFVDRAAAKNARSRDGGFVANNPTLYAIADATESSASPERRCGW